MSDWKRIFDENRVIPPPSQTSRLAHGPSQAFQLVLKRLDGLQLKQVEEVRSDSFELRVTLFDNSLHRFFGRTWKSKPHQATKQNQDQPSKVHFNENYTWPSICCISSALCSSALNRNQNSAALLQRVTAAAGGRLSEIAEELSAMMDVF
ncbi:nephrocystin-4 isoform X1 [Tachysurus ichikawai]